MTNRSNAALGNPRATPAPTAGTDVTPRRRRDRRADPTTSGGRPDIGPAPPPGPPYPGPHRRRSRLRLRRGARPTRRHRAARARRSTRSSSAPAAQLVVYTQVKPESDTPEKAERDAVALIDQWGIGREGFDDGMVILYDLHRHPATGRCSSTRRPATRPPSCRTRSARRSSSSEMLPSPARLRLRRARRRGDGRASTRPRPPTTRSDLQLARQVDAAAGLVARAAPAPRAGRLGRLELAALRTRPRATSTTPRSSCRRRRPASRRQRPRSSSTGARRGTPSRPRSWTWRPAARSRFRSPTRRLGQARHRHHGPRPARYPPLAQPAHCRSGRPRRYAPRRAREARRASAARSMPRTCRKVSRVTDGFEERLEDLVAEQRLVPRVARGRDQALVAARRHRPRRSAWRRTFFGFQLPSNGLLLVGVAARRGRGRDAHRRPRHAAADAGGRPHRTRSWPPTGGRSRRRSSRRARSTRSSPAARCPGSRRPTRPSCGPTRSGSPRRSRRCSSARSRTCAPGPPRRRAPTSRSGSRPATVRRSHISGGSSRAATAGLFSGGVVPDFTAR